MYEIRIAIIPVVYVVAVLSSSFWLEKNNVNNLSLEVGWLIGAGSYSRITVLLVVR